MGVSESSMIRLRVRRNLMRIANFVRPKPRMVPLTVDQVLDSAAGRDLVERFISFYYGSGTAPSMNYSGVEMLKNPCDVWMTVELFQRLRPTAVVETGTNQGGSALFYADMLRFFGIDAPVVTIDFNPKWSTDPVQRGINSIIGYSTDGRVVSQVRAIVDERQRARPGHVLVFLDCGHSEEQVLDELHAYAPLVTKESYVVVEDTHVNGHPSFPTHGPGPWEAVDKFLAESTDFVPDRTCERFLLTFNPRGWLKRK